MKKIAIILGGFLLAQIIVAQQFRIISLSDRLAISEKSKEIEKDQSNDLAYQLYQAQMENKFDSTKDFVSGVAAVLKNPQNFESIWHDGYDRGVAQQKQQEEFAYTSGKKEDK